MKKEGQILKALADETRLRILQLLAAGELCVCELMAVLDLPQSTVSRHLSYLKNSGWVQDRRDGVWMYYRVNEESNPLVKAILPELAKQLGQTRQGEVDQASLVEFQKKMNLKSSNE